jgi:hypothetical protein
VGGDLGLNGGLVSGIDGARDEGETQLVGAKATYVCLGQTLHAGIEMVQNGGQWRAQSSDNKEGLGFKGDSTRVHG